MSKTSTVGLGMWSWLVWHSRTQELSTPELPVIVKELYTPSICLIESLVLSISRSKRRQMKSLGTSLLLPLKDFLSKLAYKGRKVFNNIFFHLAGFAASLWKEFEGTVFVKGAAGGGVVGEGCQTTRSSCF